MTTTARPPAIRTFFASWPATLPSIRCTPGSTAKCRAVYGLSLFDPEGLFIGDASYLFVPDNEHYEQSDLLWFDEHNHPVDAGQVDLSDKRYQQHRCYKLVSLIHVNRKLASFFVVAARVVPG